MAVRDYVELRAASAFSFLRGSSLPEDLVDRARRSSATTRMALVDRDGVYGAPRFHGRAASTAARQSSARESTLDGGGRLCCSSKTRAATRTCAAWSRNAKAGAAQGRGAPRRSTIWRTRRRACVALGGGDAARRSTLPRAASSARGALYLEVQRHLRRRRGARATARASTLAPRAQGLPLVATNDVRYATPARRRSSTCSPASARRPRSTTPAAACRATPSATSSRRPRWRALFRDLPERRRTHARARRRAAPSRSPISATGSPSIPVPPTARRRHRYLRTIARRGARERYRPLTTARAAQLERELALIGKLELAGYFLIVWDIVDFCRAAAASWCRAAARRPTAPSATRSASPPSIRSAWSCSSSASSPRSAASGPTSISICRRATGARRSSSTSTSATARAARP